MSTYHTGVRSVIGICPLYVSYRVRSVDMSSLPTIQGQISNRDMSSLRTIQGQICGYVLSTYHTEVRSVIGICPLYVPYRVRSVDMSSLPTIQGQICNRGMSSLRTIQGQICVYVLSTYHTEVRSVIGICPLYIPYRVRSVDMSSLPTILGSDL